MISIHFEGRIVLTFGRDHGELIYRYRSLKPYGIVCLNIETSPIAKGAGRGEEKAERGAPPSRGGAGGVEGRAARGGEGRGGVAAAAAQFGGAVARGDPSTRPQAIYLMDSTGSPRRVAIRTGFSDGKFTQSVEGEVQPGDKVIVGQATSRVQTNARPPGGGRMF